MAWVAFDRAVKGIEQFGLPGPLERWRKARDRIHASICERGFDSQLGSFVQSYGSKDLDASLLMLPLVGFLPATDPRVRGTVAAIEASLLRDGFVARYTTRPEVDGLPVGEGTFLPCSFWLADNYALQGRRDEAVSMFERLAGLANDVGLLSEEYDPSSRRLLGNFPQAFSHVSLINTALTLGRGDGPVEHRRQ
jgi:GH15 family glucan-1,4-alpha-glucosidase